MNSDELLELLSPHLRDRSAIPSDFEPITVRIRLESEGAIIRSMYTSMRGGSEFYLTLEGKDGGAVRFWKYLRNTRSRRIKTIAQPDAVATI